MVEGAGRGSYKNMKEAIKLEQVMLETSQMLEKHPLLHEKDRYYKLRYLNLLDYFVRKYSADDPWSEQTLKLYIKKLLKEEDYQYNNFNLQHDAKFVLSTRFYLYPFEIYSYRYCVIIDCIFICAYNDKEKAEQIFEELSSVYRWWYRRKICRVFNSLYDTSILTWNIKQIEYLKECWNINQAFIKKEPIKVMVTANMSAGKSTLLNALVGKKVTKTQNDACTAKIHNIVSKPYEDGFCYELDYLLELDADYNTLMEDNLDNHSGEITVGSFFRTINQEPKRIWLIDTPGVNSSQNIEHKLLSEKTICNTDANLLIYLLNGENIGTYDDRRHLMFILEKYCGNIIFVVNKVDRFRKKEDSIQKTIDTVVSDLINMGFESPVVVPISAYGAYLAKKQIFAEILDEDEQDEYDRMVRKMKKEEYQLETYYPEAVKEEVHMERDDASYQLLLHSGLLHLENMIYNERR